ncbi:hypothetical protein [Anaerotruncus rubiinfantis]|uniref:hypothetical protein n=1 Tax=Anaerotruncus rubiinfantis TaxID=1720200 RepID=UPI001898B52F|nr:hypothetical protein [Anaerotruncus rubiinfantis]
MNWLRRFMMGRYGTDQLNYTLLALALTLMLLERLAEWHFLYLFSFLALAVCYLRMFSRDITRRYQENQRFLQVFGPVRRHFSSAVSAVKDSRTHCHFKCPSCGQKLRVPRGKGKLSITCPNCRTQFVKKT